MLFDRRYEQSFFLKTDLYQEDLIFHDYSVSNYDRPFVTTVYIGASNDRTFLSPLLIKIRYYSDQPNADVFFIPDDQMCFIEIKTENLGKGVYYREKYRSYKKDGYPLHMQYKECLSLINGSNLGDTQEYQKIISLVQSFKKKHNVTNLFPVGATSYRRKHYAKQNDRITIDSNIHFYKAVAVQHETIFFRLGSFNKKIVEIKSQDEGQFILEQEKRKKWLGKNESRKGGYLQTLLKNSIDFVEPELKLIHGGWDIIEREVKVDLSNTIDFLSLLEGLSNDYYIGIIQNDIVRKRYHCFQGKPLFCTMEKADSERVLMKYKSHPLVEQGILVRKEFVREMNDENIQACLDYFDVNEDLSNLIVTPEMERKRKTCFIYNKQNLNVYSIHFDTCTLQGKKECLYQIELEFEGLLMNEADTFNVNLMSRELLELSDQIKRKVAILGADVLSSQAKKEDWILNQ